MNKQIMTMDVFDKYLQVMNGLWQLNQSMMRQNMEYTLWQVRDKDDLDLPF